MAHAQCVSRGRAAGVFSHGRSRGGRAGVGEYDWVVNGAGSRPDGARGEREGIVSCDGRHFTAVCAVAAGAGRAALSVGADAEVEVVVALVVAAVVGFVPPGAGVAAVAVSVPVVVGGVCVVEP